jgi:hypothetical protein
MNVVPLSVDLEEEAEALVASRPEALCWHSIAYREMLLASPDFDCQDQSVVALDDDGKVRGVLLIVSRNDVWNSLAWFGANGGAIGDEEGVTALYEWYDEVSRLPASATITTSPYVDARDERIPGDVRLVLTSQITHLLTGEPSKSAVRNARKAESHGVEAICSFDLLDDLIRLHEVNAPLVDASVRSREFFEGMLEYLDCEIWGASVDGKIVGAVLLAYYGETCEYVIPAQLPEYRSLQPMAAVLDAAMGHAWGRGMKKWNWGNSTNCAEGVARFKRKWGGVDHTNAAICRVNDEELWTMGNDDIVASWGYGFFVVPFLKAEWMSWPTAPEVEIMRPEAVPA